MALTATEEAALRLLARDNPLPLARPAVQYREAPAVGWGDLIDRALAKGKMWVQNWDEDWEVLNRVKHVMKKGEKLGQFYSRTCLGRASILRMTKDEITQAVALAEKNNLESCVQEPQPPKFMQTQQRRHPVP